MRNLRGKDVHNGAMVALDYQTGELVAYVGSADYYATKSTQAVPAEVRRRRQRLPPARIGVQAVQLPDRHRRQEDDRRVDVHGHLDDFGGNYTPADADNLERGPVRVRNALQFSLNIPAVKAALVNGAGPSLRPGPGLRDGLPDATRRRPGCSIALGVQEVRPVDLVTAYGTLANGGKKIGHTTILSRQGPDRQRTSSRRTSRRPATRSRRPQAAFIVTDILAGNTDPKVNPFWGKFEITGPGGKHRPATLKTGTNNDAKDLNAYGYIAAPDGREPDGGQLRARGRRLDRQQRQHGDLDAGQARVLDRRHDLHLAGLPAGGHGEVGRRRLRKRRAASSRRRSTRSPGSSRSAGGQVDRRVVHPRHRAAGQRSRPAPAARRPRFDTASRRHTTRTGCRPTRLDQPGERGPGVAGGVNRSPTAYFYNGRVPPYGSSWGALVAGHGCAAPSPSVTCYPVPTRRSERRRAVVRRSRRADPSANILFEPCPTPGDPESPVRVTEQSSRRRPRPPTPTPTEPPTPAPTPEAPTPTADAHAGPTPTPAAVRPPRPARPRRDCRRPRAAGARIAPWRGDRAAHGRST